MNSELADFIRAEKGRSYRSDWLTVDQALIDRFADTTRDWMFLHVDPVKAAETEFGGTIAHGFLLLSLLAPLRSETPRPRLPGMRMGVNYGFDKIRFISPVRSGSRVRATFMIAELAQDGPGKIREAMDVTLEVEGMERPAVVARWLTMYLL
ncbi:MAG: MaoC family dehydratase [Novosphingobium sp.]|jgi:acyl dehydratase|nr:MaoC family dehydratase [Novosphingobium sp.]